MSAAGSAERAGPPLWLLAELTYRCPLHCVFCSNPLDYARHDAEMDTAQWLDVRWMSGDLYVAAFTYGTTLLGLGLYSLRFVDLPLR